MIFKKKNGDKYDVILNDTFTKEEAKKAIANRNFAQKRKDILIEENVTIVAASLLQENHAIALEDQNGKIHIMAIGEILRRGLDTSDFLNLEEIKWE